MTQRTQRGMVLTAAGVLAVCTAVGCARPQPKYEYGETETTITTAPPPGRRAVTTTTLAPKSPAWKRGEGR